MADRFLRTQDDATWTTGDYVTTADDWRDLSRKVFKSVNGDRGGVWAPRAWTNGTTTRGIKIGGSGLQVVGQTVIDYDGKIQFKGGAVIQLANNDWPSLGSTHVGRERSIVTPTTLLQVRDRYTWILNRQYMAMQSVACTIQIGNSILIRPSFSLPLRVHDGARFTKATLRFRVPTDHGRVPYRTPRMRIIRVDRFGEIVPLQSQTSGTDIDGYVSFSTPGSADAWFAEGSVQSFVYTCDQNNTIDTAFYHYYAQVIEEQSIDRVQTLSEMDGSKERVLYFVDRIYVDDSGFSIPNGIPSGLAIGKIFALAGEGGLPLDQNNGVGNGVWIIKNNGDWVRWTDLDNVPGLLIAAKETFVGGQAWGRNSVWELIRPVDRPDSAGMNLYQYPVPRGNIYHSVTCDFDSIVDMRPQ